MSEVDTTELRREVLAMLCEGLSIRAVTRELPQRHPAAAGLGPAARLELAGIIRQLAEGRRELLTPGRYRRQPRARRAVAG